MLWTGVSTPTGTPTGTQSTVKCTTAVHTSSVPAAMNFFLTQPLLSEFQFSQSESDGVLGIHLFTCLRNLSHTSPRDVLGTLGQAIVHLTSTHTKKEYWTNCNFAHSAPTVLVVWKFEHVPQVMIPMLATLARTCGQVQFALAGANLLQTTFRTRFSRIQRRQTSPRQIWYPLP